MGRMRRYTRPDKNRAVGLMEKRNVTGPNSRERRNMTPVRISNLPPLSHRTSVKGRGIIKPRASCFKGRRLCSKGIMTPCSKDPSQDSTSMIMPSGVSSFLLDCMDLDSEKEDTLPSIERVRKAEACDDGAGLVSEDEMLYQLVKNSTLLDLSHAMDIAMQQPPNLSSILELSPVTDGQAAKVSFCLSPPQAVSSIGSSPLLEIKEMSASTKDTAGGDIRTFRAEERTPETKRVVVLSPVVKRRPLAGRDKPIKCRKVTFNDIVSTRDITVLKPQAESRSQAYDVQRNDGFKMRGNTLSGASKELMVPREPSSEPAKFFDFADEKEKEAFFQRLRRTCTLQFPVKPLMTPALKTSVPCD